MLIHVGRRVDNILYGYFVAFGHIFINTTVNLDFKKRKKESEGLSLDRITLLCVLSACAHSGLIYQTQLLYL